jgi:GR25 family glycosyltransferase involved in LPS biosynthesis
MKHYVITVMDIEQSVQAAERCIRSGKKHGIDIEMFEAVTPRNTELISILKEEGINPAGFEEVYSRFDNCVAAFLSHYTLWKMSAQSKTEFTIFEHDAVVVNTIPEVMSYKGIINLGKPSYGKFNAPRFIGVGPLTSKPYFPGAHAYRVTQKGARALVQQAQAAARPTDVFLNLQTFPDLQEYYPWPVEAKDSFTTIQKQQGCLAKHSYGETYEIL